MFPRVVKGVYSSLLNSTLPSYPVCEKVLYLESWRAPTLYCNTTTLNLLTKQSLGVTISTKSIILLIRKMALNWAKLACANIAFLQAEYPYICILSACSKTKILKLKPDNIHTKVM